MQLTRDYVKASDASANSSLMTIQSVRAPLATTINVNTVAGVPTRFTGTMGTPHTFNDPVTGETITIISEASAVDFAGHVDSGHLEIDKIAPGYTDQGSKVGDIVIIRPTSQWADLVAEFLTPTASVMPFAGSTAPEYWLLCDGSSVSRTDYPRLFNAIGTTFGSISGTEFNLPDLRSRVPVGAGTAVTKVAKFASRSGNVLTLTGLSNTSDNEFQTGQAVVYSTSGTTIGGLTNGTTYYVRRTGNSTISLATSRFNAVNGTVITLTSDGSGDRIFTLSLTARSVGDTGGEEAHALIRDELAQHTHSWNTTSSLIMNSLTSPGVAQFNGGNGQLGATVMQNSGGNNEAHNNMQPFTVLNYIIKT